jgi:hypothetical protein
MRFAVLLLLTTMMGGNEVTEIMAQESAQRVPFRVRETAGIRRFGYLATARLPLPPGALKDAKNTRVLDAQGKAASAQITAVEKHADGSVKWLEVDMNLSPAPLETMEFQLEYGANVTHAPPPRGLTLAETAETFQVSTYYTIRKDGNPLVQRVNYGRDYVKEGGINIIAKEGTVEHRLRDAKNLKWTVEKQGALQVRLHCEGEYPAPGGNAPLPFALTLEFSNSKSWVGITHVVRGNRKVALSLVSHFNLNGQLLWDADVGYWLYGVVNPDEQMTFSQTSDAWMCKSGKAGLETPYAANAADNRRSKGWGHFQESKDDGNVVAFGIADFGANGEHTFTLRSDGTMTVQREPQANLQLRAFFHFIPVPLQRTAHTSPPSMMLPLEAKSGSGF